MMMFTTRFWAAFFLVFVNIHAYAPSITSQQSVAQQESPELDELVEDAVVEEIARLVDVQKSDRKTIAKKILILAKKPATSENITFVMSYLNFSLQQRLDEDTSTSTFGITNCAKLVIEDLITVAGMAPNTEFKKKEPASVGFSLSRIAILGCCAYIIKLLFGVYSTLNSVFSVVNTATEAYSQVQTTLDSLTGLVSSDGAQTRSVMQSEVEALGTKMHKEVEALAAKNHDEMIVLTQKMMLEEKERIEALGTQLEAQHKELKALQAQASAAQVTELATIRTKLEAAGTKTAETLEAIQDSMLKMKSAQQKQRQAQFKKLESMGMSTEKILRAMQKENTAVRIDMARVMGKVDVARSKISEATRCVTQGEVRLTDHVRDVGQGVRTVGRSVEAVQGSVEKVSAKVDRVSEQVAQMSKEQKESLIESFRKLQEAVISQKGEARAKKTFMENVQTWGWEASLAVLQGAVGSAGGMLAKEGIKLIFRQFGWGKSEGDPSPPQSSTQNFMQGLFSFVVPPGSADPNK